MCFYLKKLTFNFREVEYLGDPILALEVAVERWNIPVPLVGYSGVLQAVFDGLKLIKKEQLVMFFFSSVVSFLFVPIAGFISIVFFKIYFALFFWF